MHIYITWSAYEICVKLYQLKKIMIYFYIVYTLGGYSPIRRSQVVLLRVAQFATRHPLAKYIVQMPACVYQIYICNPPFEIPACGPDHCWITVC